MVLYEPRMSGCVSVCVHEGLEGVDGEVGVV